jgi:hypothetical protein
VEYRYNRIHETLPGSKQVEQIAINWKVLKKCGIPATELLIPLSIFPNIRTIHVISPQAGHPTTADQFMAGKAKLKVADTTMFVKLADRTWDSSSLVISRIKETYNWMMPLMTSRADSMDESLHPGFSVQVVQAKFD